VGSGVGAWAIGVSVPRFANANAAIRILSHSFALESLDTRAGCGHRSGRDVRGDVERTRRLRQRSVERVRVLVVVLIGLVVVLAVLTEVCLLQAASMRRKVRAVLPPPEDDEEEGR
jgi:hypothetical protein